MFGLIGLYILGGLNIFALVLQSIFLWSDRKFKLWANKSELEKVKKKTVMNNPMLS